MAVPALSSMGEEKADGSTRFGAEASGLTQGSSRRHGDIQNMLGQQNPSVWLVQIPFTVHYTVDGICPLSPPGMSSLRVKAKNTQAGRRYLL